MSMEHPIKTNNSFVFYGKSANKTPSQKQCITALQRTPTIVKSFLDDVKSNESTEVEVCFFF